MTLFRVNDTIPKMIDIPFSLLDYSFRARETFNLVCSEHAVIIHSFLVYVPLNDSRKYDNFVMNVEFKYNTIYWLRFIVFELFIIIIRIYALWKWAFSWHFVG